MENVIANVINFLICFLVACVTGLGMQMFVFGITFAAMTLLYEQIFIEEETADIAMIKSMGMDRATIRKWHFERIMILIAIASVIGIIMAFTVSKYALELLGISTLSLVRF